jgi:hypothetical protein
MLKKIHSHNCLYYNENNIFVLGGYDGKIYLNNLFKYDLENDCWTQM